MECLKTRTKELILQHTVVLFFFSITKKKITGLLMMSEMVYND